MVSDETVLNKTNIWYTVWRENGNLKFNWTRAKQVLFWGKFNETFMIHASSLRAIETYLIRLRYDKRFGSKT
jgi:hypothetical protein